MTFTFTFTGLMIRFQFLLGTDILLPVTAQGTVFKFISASCPMDDGLFLKFKQAGA
jgi:hypothetical protein